MPKRGWCSHIAIAGWGVAIILLCVLLSGVVAVGPSPRSVSTNPEWQQGKTDKDNAKPRLAVHDPYAAEYEQYCRGSDKPKDCIIQLRTAEATERQAKYAFYGLWLAGPTILLSALGLWLVRRTLNETARAAKAAERAIEVQVRIEKPLLFVEGVLPRFLTFKWMRLLLISSSITPAG
jgi:hypothetical protein